MTQTATQTAFSLNLDLAREQMLEHQVRAWEVLNPRVLEALRAVPREQFVPQTLRNLAFADTEIPLGPGVRMLAPKVEGRILQALEIQADDRVLQIGTGSGYLAACLARLGRSVHSVEIDGDFTQAAKKRLHALKVPNVTLETRDAARLNWVKEPFDAIAVTGSMPVLEDSFLHALTIGGRLFVVTGAAPAMQARLITRTGQDHWAQEVLFETVLTPLINAYNPPRFPF